MESQRNLRLVPRSKKLLMYAYPNIAKEIGSDAILFLQQVHYWITRPKNKNVREGRKWVYKTYPEWQQELPSLGCLRTIQYTIRKLEKMGVLISSNKFNRILTDRTKCYSIDYQTIDSLEAGTKRKNCAFQSKFYVFQDAKFASSNHKTTPKRLPTGDYYHGK